MRLVLCEMESGETVEIAPEFVESMEQADVGARDLTRVCLVSGREYVLKGGFGAVADHLRGSDAH